MGSGSGIVGWEFISGESGMVESRQEEERSREYGTFLEVNTWPQSGSMICLVAISC